MSSILNFTLIKSNTNHTLRALTVVLFPFAFFILLIEGLISNRVNPAIGIIHLFLSALLGAFLIHHANKSPCNCQGFSSHPVILLADAILAIAIFVELILSWVSLSKSWRGSVILGTYGTNFLIVNLCIHVYMVLQHIYKSLSSSSYYATSCPQCHYAPFSGVKGTTRAFRNGSMYDPLLDQSLEDEYQANGVETASISKPTQGQAHAGEMV